MIQKLMTTEIIEEIEKVKQNLNVLVNDYLINFQFLLETKERLKNEKLINEEKLEKRFKKYETWYDKYAELIEREKTMKPLNERMKEYLNKMNSI